jgi:alpha-aminoadipate carrier protein LysW
LFKFYIRTIFFSYFIVGAAISTRNNFSYCCIIRDIQVCVTFWAIHDDAAVGEIVSCADCGADYEIAKKDGSNVELKQAETVGEDWGE